MAHEAAAMKHQTMKPTRTGPEPGRGIAGAAAAFVGLVALAVGLPALLWTAVGWPLPHVVPSLSGVRAALTGSAIPDEVLLNTVAVVAWLAWAQFMLCVLVEIRAAVRGRLPGKVPFAGLSQAIAARLVGALMLLTTLAPAVAARPALAAEPPRPVAAEAVTPPTSAAAAAEEAATRAEAREAATAEEDGLPRYTVRRRETLWRIAERYLGDGSRWREIERLNRGREQPGGRGLTGGDWIHPGWELLLPGDAAGLPERRGKPGREAPLPGPPPARVPPPGPAANGHAPLAPPASGAVQGRLSDLPGVRYGGIAGAEREGAPLSTLPAAGLLAAGVMLSLSRLRRVQQRRRLTGRRIRLPGGEAARVERALRSVEEPEAASLLDLALRVMALGIRQDRLAAPLVTAVLFGDGEIEVRLAEPAPVAPAPFVALGRGRRWVLPGAVTPAELRAVLAGSGADTPAPLPALVTVASVGGGAGAAGGQRLLVNLEASGTAVLHGPPEHARALLGAIAVELSTSPGQGFFDLLLVGFGADLGRLGHLERARVLDSLGDALPALERQASAAAALVAERGCDSVLDGRITGVAADGWTPTVVLCARPPATEELDRLAAVTADRRRSTVAAVVVAGPDGVEPAGAPEAAWHLEVDRDRLRIPALGLEGLPQRLLPEDAVAIGDLLETAKDVEGVPAVRPARDPSPGSPATAPAVEIRVLGRIEVAGIERIERSKSMELLVFLALHPRGVDAEQLWEALWPETPLNRGTLHTTVSVARSRLGAAPGGEPGFPPARDGIYRLHPEVGLDWARFQALVELAERLEEDGVVPLRTAVELVRGIPFESAAARSYDWAAPHRMEMESAIADASERLAELYLRLGDPTGARWAARRGLVASPYDERLYRVLMLAAHAAGSMSGVDAVLEELVVKVGAEVEPYDQLHPQTVELYEQLRPSRRNAAR